MTAREIKENLHQWIEAIDDPDFLEALMAIVAQKQQSAELALTPTLAKEIEAAEKEIQSGNTLSSQQVQAMIEKWRKEK